MRALEVVVTDIFATISRLLFLDITAMNGFGEDLAIWYGCCGETETGKYSGNYYRNNATEMIGRRYDRGRLMPVPEKERAIVWGPRRIMWTAPKGPCQGGQPGNDIVAKGRLGYVGKEVPDGLGLDHSMWACRGGLVRVFHGRKCM